MAIGVSELDPVPQRAVDRVLVPTTRSALWPR